MSLFGFFKKTDEQSISKPSTTNTYTVQQLPLNFAEKLMDLQMQLEFLETYNSDVVHKLNQMYSMAIQYYINIDIRKTNHFQKKLTALLSNPITLDIIDNKPEPVKINTKINSQYSNELKQQLNRFNSQSEIVVKSMIQGSDFKAAKTSRVIADSIDKQENKIKQRLEERSRSKSKKTLSNYN